MDHKLGPTALTLGLVVGAVVCFALYRVYAAWIDRRSGKDRRHD